MKIPESITKSAIKKIERRLISRLESGVHTDCLDRFYFPTMTTMELLALMESPHVTISSRFFSLLTIESDLRRDRRMGCAIPSRVHDIRINHSYIRSFYIKQGLICK